MNNMKTYRIITLLAIVCPIRALAQESVELPSRSITVESTYNPIFSEVGKIMPLPEKESASRQQVPVNYLTEANPYGERIRKEMNVFGLESDNVKSRDIAGLLRIGYGVRNISDGLLDFGWSITDRDYLKVSGMLDGWNSKPDKKWQSHMFNSNISAEYSRRFKTFDASLKSGYGYSRFNYRPGVLMSDEQLAASSLFQNVRQGELSGAIRSNAGSNVDFYVNGGGQWLIRDGLDVNGTVRSNKEGIVRFGAGFNKPLDKGSLSFDYRQKSTVYRWQGLYGCEYTNFTTFTLSPVWHYSKGEWETDLGLNLDMRTRAGEPFLASPVMRLTYSLRDNFKIRGSITGGLEEYDMRRLAAISPYWSEENRIYDGYTVFNLSTGIFYNNPSKLSASVDVGYRYTIDEVFQVAQDSMLVSSVFKQQAASVLYLKGALDFRFHERAQLKFDMIYSNYLGSYFGRKMELKPAIDASVFGRMTIIRGLDAMLTYRLMGFHKVVGESMPVVNDLSLTADYDYNRNISFYTTLKHLFGGNYYYYAGYRTLRPAVLVGVVYKL